ncbi:Conserved_hypothetical protein [Hexamita inflata]|uniref:Uncharacterized protein n=1 Tax=Hexamita inflata TaxID=28002 RepID=A0AA86TTX0_9EUKA|nr:Conserved hypothetical protein [Hexamita inflata]
MNANTLYTNSKQDNLMLSKQLPFLQQKSQFGSGSQINVQADLKKLERQLKLDIEKRQKEAELKYQQEKLQLSQKLDQTTVKQQQQVAQQMTKSQNETKLSRVSSVKEVEPTQIQVEEPQKADELKERLKEKQILLKQQKQQSEEQELRKAQEELQLKRQLKVLQMQQEEEKRKLIREQEAKLKQEAESSRQERLQKLESEKKQRDMQRMVQLEEEARKRELEQEYKMKEFEDSRKKLVFIEERKFLMRELDGAKQQQFSLQEELERQKSQAVQQQIEEARKPKAPPSLLNVQEEEPAIQKVEKKVVDRLRPVEREEHKLFYKAPVETVEKINSLYIVDELERCQSYLYEQKYSLQIAVDTSQMTRQEMVADAVQDMFLRQKEWIQTLTLIRDEQQQQQSPALAQINMILQFEAQLLPAIQFCQCVGDIDEVVSEIGRLRRSIKIQLTDPQRDREKLDQLIQKKMGKCEQQTYILPAVLHEQILKGNRELNNLKKLLMLNQEYLFSIQQQSTLDGYFSCERMYEKAISMIDLDLIE